MLRRASLRALVVRHTWPRRREQWLHGTAKREIWPVVLGAGLYVTVQVVQYLMRAQRRLEAKERIERRWKNGLPLPEADVELVGKEGLEAMGIRLTDADDATGEAGGFGAAQSVHGRLQFPVVGFDIGATALKVCIAEESANGVEVLENAEGRRSTPAFVGIAPGEEAPSCGAILQQNLFQRPGSAVWAVPQLLAAGEEGAEAVYPDGFKSFAAVSAEDGKPNFEGQAAEIEAVYRVLLGKCAEIAHRRTETVGAAVWVQPASLLSQFRSKHDALAALAADSMSVVTPIVCPDALGAVAEAVRIGSLSTPQDWPDDASRVLVVDAGGFATCYSLVSKHDPSGSSDLLPVEKHFGARIEQSEGKTALGGMALDEAITLALNERFLRENRDAPSLVLEGMSHQRLRDAAEGAKMELSAKSVSTIQLPFITADRTGPKNLISDFSSTDLGRACSGVLDSMVDGFRAFLQGHGGDCASVHALVLTGGCARIPTLRDAFRREAASRNIAHFVCSEAPEEDVASGATWLGRQMVEATQPKD